MPMLRRHPVISTAVAFLAACGGESAVVTPPPPSIAVSLVSTSLWAGAPVTIRLRNFHDAYGGATLRIGSSDVVLSRTNDTTLTGALPRSVPGGVTVPMVTLNGTDYPLASTVVGGLASITTFSDAAVAAGIAGNHDGRLTMLSEINGQRVGIYDLEAAARTVIPITPGSFQSYPGPSSVDDEMVAVMRRGSSPDRWEVALWQLTGDPAQTRTYPVNNSGSASFANVVMRLSENVFLTAGAHSYSVWRLSGASPSFEWSDLVRAESVNQAILSPRKDRATFTVNAILQGVPVFDAATGDIAYDVAFRTAQGAAFSANGDVLAMTGVDATTNRNRVRLLNATTGAVLREWETTDAPSTVAFDPNRPLMYLLMLPKTGTGYLQVIDRNTLATVAEMEATGLPSGSAPRYAALAAGAPTNAVFLYYIGRVFKFTIPAM